MARTVRDVGAAPVSATNPFSTGASSPGEPTKQPPTRICTGEPPESTRFVHSSGGADCTQRCQASRTPLAAPGEKRSANTVKFGAGWVSKVNEVTTPKFPPPPPRSAQNRSGSELADAVRSFPSGVTIKADAR